MNKIFVITKIMSITFVIRRMIYWGGDSDEKLPRRPKMFEGGSLVDFICCCCQKNFETSVGK